jgi:hypothetical protein
MTMQRDMKVGLAVGVALIGIVGALFFRRENDSRHAEAPPPMKDTREIDRLIGEKGKAPYMDGIEDASDRVAPVPPPQNPVAKSKFRNDDDDAPKFGRTDDNRGRERNSQNTVPAPVPGSSADDPVYAHNRDWEPAGATSPGGKKEADAERAGAGSTNSPPRTHVIQAGETLSGLAARYLGSSARFREIYEANRNVLRSPDDLRDGVTIVIPDAPKPRDAQHVSGNGGPTSSSGNSGVKAASARSAEAGGDASPAPKASQDDVPREKIRFAPVKGGPFSAGRVAPQTNSPKSDSRKSDDAN